jgi:hypothetical protein
MTRSLISLRVRSDDAEESRELGFQVGAGPLTLAQGHGGEERDENRSLHPELVPGQT